MLRLKQRLPLTWTGLTTLRVGVQDPAVTLEVTDEEARAISKMREGITKAALVKAAGRKRAAELVKTLQHLLDDTQEEIEHRIRVTGTTPLADGVRRLVKHARMGSGSEHATVLVPVVPWRLEERSWQRYLTGARPCLPVVVGDQQVTIGPLWEPGVSACWRCAHPISPHPVPLPDESRFALALRPLEEAVVIGVMAEALRRLRTGELVAGDEAVFDRETRQVSWRHVAPDAQCPCQFDLLARSGAEGTVMDHGDCGRTQLIA